MPPPRSIIPTSARFMAAAGRGRAAISSRWNTPRRPDAARSSRPAGRCYGARHSTSPCRSMGLGEIAHAAGVVRRNLSTRKTFMLRPDGIVKVLDFGLAKLLASDSSGEGTTTNHLPRRPGKVVGTVAYMSPEQAWHCSGISGRTSGRLACSCMKCSPVSGRSRAQAQTDTLAAILSPRPSASDPVRSRHARRTDSHRRQGDPQGSGAAVSGHEGSAAGSSRRCAPNLQLRQLPAGRRRRWPARTAFADLVWHCDCGDGRSARGSRSCGWSCVARIERQKPCQPR